MKITQLFKNLTDYKNLNLEEITHKGRFYKTDIYATPSIFFSQGFGASNKKDSYNARLAKGIEDALEIFGEKPIIAQMELHEFLPTFITNRKDYYSIGELHKDGEAGIISKVHTHEVIKMAKGIIEGKSIDCKKILFQAHPGHIQRVLWISEKEGLIGRPFIEANPIWIQDDPQPFVRSKMNWLLLEIAARIREGYIYKEM